MSQEINENNHPADAVIREKLREMYAAPSDPAYWSGLQVRILERVADSNPGMWWVFLGRWARAGVVAAALALMAAGIASVAINRVEARVAYQSMLSDNTPLTTLERISNTAGLSDREAALRYVFSQPER